MWWNPRLLVLLWCIGWLARWSYRAALHEVETELDSWAALIAFWIPLVGVIFIAGSLVVPVARRRWRQLRR
jgi:hypothetical protein